MQYTGLHKNPASLSITCLDRYAATLGMGGGGLKTGPNLVYLPSISLHDKALAMCC